MRTERRAGAILSSLHECFVMIHGAARRRLRTGAQIAAWAVPGTAAAFLIALGFRQAFGVTKDAAAFPDGYDAVTAAPASHRVIFDNALVRVLEVTLPQPGTTEPMHHHRWPSFFLVWDTGGQSPHIRYHQPGNVVRDVPIMETPRTTGHWSVRWMEPEPMHAIETVENHLEPGDLPSVRVEIKVQP